MGNFKRDGRKSGSGFNRGFDGGKSFGGGKRFGGRNGDKSDKYKAICSECGVNCEIPFRPTGERPVFCSNCFQNQGNGGGRPDKFGDRGRGRSGFRDRQMHDVVCTKCGKNCQVPFKPMGDKPIFCDNCFKQDRSGGKGSGEIMEQIRLLNIKIDKIMGMLTSKDLIEKIKKLEVEKETATKKPIKEKKEKTKIKIAAKKATVKKKK